MVKNVLISLTAATLLSVWSCNPSKKSEKALDSGADSVVTQQDTTDRAGVSDIVSSFIKAYSERDQDALNRLIHPDIGLTIIHRPGAMNWFERASGIDFDRPIPSYYPYAKPEKSYRLTYEAIPSYDCSTESWSKTGLYIDLITQTNILAPIAAEMSEYEDVELDPNYQQHLSDAELNSYRVVLTGAPPLIFHVKEYQGKWYVTILDRAYADCSA